MASTPRKATTHQLRADQLHSDLLGYFSAFSEAVACLRAAAPGSGLVAGLLPPAAADAASGWAAFGPWDVQLQHAVAVGRLRLLRSTPGGRVTARKKLRYSSRPSPFCSFSALMVSTSVVELHVELVLLEAGHLRPHDDLLVVLLHVEVPQPQSFEVLVKGGERTAPQAAEQSVEVPLQPRQRVLPPVGHRAAPGLSESQEAVPLVYLP